MPKHIHYHYAPSVTLTHTTHINSSTAATYAPHCHPSISGQTRRSECTAGQMDGEAGWWTTSGRLDYPHSQGSWEWVDNNNMIRKLSNEPTTSHPPCPVSVNQVAHQLLVNSRGTMPSKPKCPVLPPATEGDYSMAYLLSEEEYRKVVAILKNNKAVDVLMEQLKNLGSKAHRWLLTMLNKCVMDNNITTLWRQSKIIAILKPGKDSAIPKSYGPMCHT